MQSLSSITVLECSRCGAQHDPDIPQNLCQSCHSGPLMARYDLQAARRTLTAEALRSRPNDMWRYHELLPVRDAGNIVSMGEGRTPLVKLETLGPAIGLQHLSLKDEGLCPTGTFKARGASASVSKLCEWGVRAIALPTAGNAGGAFACYGARAGLEVHIAMPADAPQGAWKQAVAAGAKVYLIDGPFAHSLKFMREAIARFGWYNASTFNEPWRIEGKKTMGFELFEQFGNTPPDVIIYPTGGGVGVIAIYKAFQELVGLGLLEPGWRCRLIAVQTEGCYRLKAALDADADDTTPWEGDINTVVPGMAGPHYTLGDHVALQAIRSTGGDVAVVNDQEIMAAMRDLGSAEGLFICPEGAATLAAARKLLEAGVLGRDERIVLLNTGNGLKYQEFVTETPDDDASAWRLLQSAQ